MVDFETKSNLAMIMTHLKSTWTGITHPEKFVDRQRSLLLKIMEAEYTFYDSVVEWLSI
jgi:hypothetical protein